VQLLTAPLAIVVDCASFVISAVSLAAIRAREEVSPLPPTRGTWLQLREGFAGALGQTLLRPLFAGTALGNIGDGLVFQNGVVILFLTRELRLEPAVPRRHLCKPGDRWVSRRCARRSRDAPAGPRRNHPWLPGTVGRRLWRSRVYQRCAVRADSSRRGRRHNPIAGANISTVRQIVTPDQLLGRLTSVVSVGAMTGPTAGSFAGGVIGDTVGLRPNLLLGGLLPLLGLVTVLLSPVRKLRTLDAS